MDPLRRDQVKAWIANTRRAVYTMRRFPAGPLNAIEVSERLYDLLREYLIDVNDDIGKEVYNAGDTLLLMRIPVIPDPALPFEFEALPDQPAIVAPLDTNMPEKVYVEFVGNSYADPKPILVTNLDAVARFEEKYPGITHLVDVAFVPPEE